MVVERSVNIRVRTEQHILARSEQDYPISGYPVQLYTVKSGGNWSDRPVTGFSVTT